MKKRFHRYIELDEYPGKIKVELETPQDKIERKKEYPFSYSGMKDLFCSSCGLFSCTCDPDTKGGKNGRK